MPKRRDKSEPPGSSTLGTIMLLMAAVFTFPEGRNWPVVAAIAGLGFLFTFIGSGRIYRPAVTTTADAILCRFDLWRDASFYFVLFGLPLAAAIGLLGGDFLGRFSPNFWRFLGIVMLSLWIRFLFIFVRQGRQSWLRISPMALTVHQPGQQTAATEIPRGAVEAIAATTAKMRNYDNAPTTQITYSGGDQSPAAIGSVLFGPTNTKKTAWLTVEQSDLLGGLQAWKDGDPNDPGLMDRVEAILRGQAPDSV